MRVPVILFAGVTLAIVPPAVRSSETAGRGAAADPRIVSFRLTSAAPSAGRDSPGELAVRLRTGSALPEPVFDIGAGAQRRLREAMAAEGVADPPNLEVWRRIRVPGIEAATRLARQLNRHPEVDTAYVLPLPTPPPGEVRRRGGTIESPDDGLRTTPDFTVRQTYFGSAPKGTSSTFARTLPGGNGEGVRVIDIESDWFFAHEDLRLPATVRIGGEPCTGQDCFTDHGTGVLGILAARVNGIGITGGVPGAEVLALTPSFEGAFNPANAILLAGATLDRGDVLLLELQASGPRGGTAFVPIEWIPEVFEAIRTVSLAGRIVVQPAGNGRQDLDDPIFEGRFDRRIRDSGAILVGGGDSLHVLFGKSNFGSRLDLQGWGCCVTTTGRGDLHGAGPRDAYTLDFTGTSSASAIVTAAVASVQGVVKRLSGSTLNAWQMARLLRETGTAQTGDPGRPIGPFPDLGAALGRFQVFESQVTVANAARYLLIEDGLIPAQRDYLDGLGNGNGVYDLGDLAAFLDRQGGP